MKFVDFNDERIPIGRRKVAYVKWAMMQGTPEKKAREWANKKFGFERKGKYLVFLFNCEDMSLYQFRNYTWEEASNVDCRRAEVVTLARDCGYGVMALVGDIDISLFEGLTYEGGGYNVEEITKRAEKKGYKVSIQYITP